MSFNGSGTYVRNYSWANDAANGIKIRADRMDTEDNGFATGLSTVICKDGQTTTTGMIPFAQGISTSDGLVATPAITFTADNDTGFYRVGSNSIGVTTGGALALTIAATGITAGSSGVAATGVAATGSDGGFFDCNYGASSGVRVRATAAGTGTIYTYTGATWVANFTLYSTQGVSAPGYVAIGATGTNTQIGLRILNANLTGTSQYGSFISPTVSSACTVGAVGVLGVASTAAAAFTCTSVYGFYAANNVAGAGSTITTSYGVYIENQTGGTTNYGLYSASTTNLMTGALSLGSITGAVVATQANQETATSTTTVVSPGRQQYHPSAAKAWLSCHYAAGVPTIDASYNVTSLTDTGTGTITINLTTAFSSGNFASTATQSNEGAPLCGPASASTISLVTRSTAFATVDATGQFSVSAYGDQ